jgi:NADP-dependent 3-hydroxy acid dehydrogenase YdfG
VVATDVTNFDQLKQLVDAAVKTFGRIDVMINNAGLMPHSPLERLKIDDWNRTIDVNIKGVLYGIAAALHEAAESRAHPSGERCPKDRFSREQGHEDPLGVPTGAFQNPLR